jgi:hypothetical protein
VSTATNDEAVIEWLLDGDPAVRWQVMRDLLGAPAADWKKERARTVECGWVSEMLARQGEDGEWPAGRWTASVWTLLLLVACGIPPDHPAGQKPLARMFDRHLPQGRETDPLELLQRMDLCHLGFWLGLGAHFMPDDERLQPIGAAVLTAQYEDGGWNCQLRNYPERRHSSFNTTFNVLEGLRIAAERGVLPKSAVRLAEAPAVEFMLAHRLYRSDKTGAEISDRFTRLTYPWHWHYTVLRALDYLRLTPEVDDPRLDDPIELLLTQRLRNGRWPSKGRIPGRPLFDMEKPGTDSRWNTLRALRVLQLRRRSAQAATSAS